jgi:hypothetical protein
MSSKSFLTINDWSSCYASNRFSEVLRTNSLDHLLKWSTVIHVITDNMANQVGRLKTISTMKLEGNEG